MAGNRPPPNEQRSVLVGAQIISALGRIRTCAHGSGERSAIGPTYLVVAAIATGL